MKIIILQEKLKEGLDIIERVAAKSVTFPMLNNIILKAKKNFLNLAATDLEMGINWWTLGKVESEGEAVIPARTLSNLINYFPNKPILLETKETSLYVECGNSKTILKGYNPEEFPIIPTIADNEFLQIPINSFCQSLNQVVDIATTSTTRPEISGVYFIFQKDSIKMVATDSFRLGEKTLFLDSPSGVEKSYSFILPQRAARELINILGDKEGNLKIYFSPNQVLFESLMPETSHPQTQLISRLIEGEFPNYEAIVPKKYETQVTFQRAEFLNQIKTASIFSGKVNEVKLKINPKQEKVEIFSQSQDLGEYQSSIPAKIKGKELEMAFNHKFLADGLSNVKNLEIFFELTDAGGPGVLKPVGDLSYLYVVMPIKA